MNKTLIMLNYQMKLLFRNSKSLIMGFSIPAIMFFIFSNLLGKYRINGTFSIIDFLVPAYIPIIIINGAILIYGQNFIVYKENGSLLKYKLLGVSKFNLSLSMYVASMIFQILATLILIIFARFTKEILFPVDNILLIILAFLVINIFEFSLAFLLTSFINKSVTYQGVSLIVFYYQIYLGGLTFPPEMFPEFLYKIVLYFNPIIYGLKVMRSFWSGGGLDYSNLKYLMILLIYSAFFIILGKIRYSKKRDNTI